MHGSSSRSLFEGDERAEPLPLAACGGTFKHISDVRLRQITCVILFVLFSAFIHWMVDGDPTSGETTRIRNFQQRATSKAQVGGAGGGGEADVLGNGWCYEAVETRQHWRSVQRFAGGGLTFRERVDLCSPHAPTVLFDGAIPKSDGIIGRGTLRNHPASGADDEEQPASFSSTTSMRYRSAGSGSLWTGRAVKLNTVEKTAVQSKDGEAATAGTTTVARCGVSSIAKATSDRSSKNKKTTNSRMKPFRGGTNVSWMIQDRFLDFFARTAAAAANASTSREALFAAREEALFACAARDVAMLGQLPPVADLRSAGLLSDFTLLHQEMDEALEGRLWEQTRGALRTAASISQAADPMHSSYDRLFDSTLARRGTPALHYAALAAQYTAVHSCATPLATLANVVRTPLLDPEEQVRSRSGGGVEGSGNNNRKLLQNEFAAWRLWEGGPLVIAAVCRAAPFEVIIDVSPSASWVELV